MMDKERKKEISKQPIPTKEECIAFYKELTNLADAHFVPYYKMAIKALEQQPQTDEIILSKKEYRELLSDEFEHGYDKGLSDAITSLEQEPCNDAISRQAAIDCLNADFTIDGKENMETVVDYINGAFKQIKALPSITPQQKIGYWTRELIINEYGGCIGAKMICSECGQDNGYDKRMKFCPNCGTKMEVGEC